MNSGASASNLPILQISITDEEDDLDLTPLSRPGTPNTVAVIATFWPTGQSVSTPRAAVSAAIRYLWSIREYITLSEPILVFGGSLAMTIQTIWWVVRAFLCLVRP